MGSVSRCRWCTATAILLAVHVCSVCKEEGGEINGAQTYRKFLQVGRLYRVLILLGLASIYQTPLCLRSSWRYIDIKNFLLMVHPSLYLLVS